MSDEAIRRIAMHHRALFKAHLAAYKTLMEAADADAKQERPQGEGGAATAAPDVPELGD